MGEITFRKLWKIVKVMAVVQIFNAIADYAMWAFYGFLVPSWALATLSLGYIIIIFSMKRVFDSETQKQKSN